MKREAVGLLLGFSPDGVEARGPFRVIRAGEEPPEELVRDATLSEVCARMVRPLFGGEFPDYDPDEPLEVRAVLYELSDVQGMRRTREASSPGPLAPVVEPGLRLVVAWQDFALGIFRGEGE